MKRFLILISLIASQPAYSADLGILTEEINKICPIVGVSGSASDIQALRIDFAPSATEQQKQAARDFIKSLNPDSPEIQAPDIEGFLEECLDSEAFTTQELVQILYCERQKDQAKRNALILRLIAKAPMERQLTLANIAKKHAIKLPSR